MKKNVIVIDDSALLRRVLSDIINQTEDYHVIAVAANGEDGMRVIRNTAPIHLIFLDMNMPKMNGIDLLKQMKAERINIPVVVFSAAMERESDDVIEALSLGALDFLRKPENVLAKMENFREKVQRVLDMIDNGGVSDTHGTPTSKLTTPPPRPARPRRRVSSGGGSGKLVAIASSTGGPKALQEVIPFLEANINAPVLIVQHMPKGFTESLAKRLNDVSKVKVVEASEGAVLQKGVVYLAKGGNHMRVAYEHGKHVIRLGDDPQVGGLRPYANHMYDSLIQSDYSEIICVVLTGMGADGTNGIENLSHEKNVYVISQDQASCVVYGMPKSVAQAGLSDEVEPLKDIAQAIMKKTGVC